MRPGIGVPRLIAVALAVAGLYSGCSRAHYRRDADLEVELILVEKTEDAGRVLPPIRVNPPPESRLFDPFDPDHPPIPPDDPAAHRYMHCANGIRGASQWHDDGDASGVENAEWRRYLPSSDDAPLLLSPHRAVELGLLHSREYQTEVEDLFLSALGLTLERFEFQLQWFARNDTAYRHFGTSSIDKPGTTKVDGNESNTLTTASNAGFSRSLATGGQLVVDFANSFVWEFTGSDSSSASSNIGVSLVQPLLRRAGREVRLEELTQAERAVLYATRDFARFRKQFYVDIVAGNDGFLSLLLAVQGIRNLEANLVALEQNLRLHEALAEAGIVSSIQVDQVFQSHELGKFNLIRAQNNFETDLDSYKILLGLPPDLPVKLDDTLLEPFQLNDPALTDLQNDFDHLLAVFRELDEPPSLEQLRQGFSKLEGFSKQLVGLRGQVEQELARWKSQQSNVPDGERPDRAAKEQQLNQRRLSERLTEMKNDLEKLAAEIKLAGVELLEEQRKESWQGIQQLGRRGTRMGSDLFVIQTQIRASLVHLEPVQYERQAAVQYALQNRLDLMNERARVVDAWRQITVAADRLESDLDVTVDADIATRPGHANPVDFSAAASTYRVGLRFDSPLNRKAERGIYRTSLIRYDRSRRAYMASEDRITQAVRRDLRRLDADRLNFEIARQRLISAARQVEESRDQLEAPGRAGDSSSTQDVLIALNSLLQAKNDLIGIWVAYESGRLQLLLDIEKLQLDEQGIHHDEHDHLGDPAPSSPAN